MRKILVIDDGSSYTLRWLRALVWARKEFEERDYEIKFQSGFTFLERRIKGYPKITYSKLNQLVDNLPDLDIVFLAFHWTRELFSHSDEELFRVLEKLKGKCNLLVWLDSADSTGTPKFQVMPYVDFYLKKQLLTDKMEYTKPIWGGMRVHCEYYHNMTNLDDPENNVECALLDEKYIEKLGLSWNVGLGDLLAEGNYIKKLLTPYNYAKYNFLMPGRVCNFDIHFRGSTWSSVAGYQRKLTIDHLSSSDGIKIPDVKNKIPHKEYVKEIKGSKMICSPFGWGEICGRDFESFVYGATLLKPRMDHLVTYPNWYIPNETYVPIEWDYSNFDDIVADIRENRNSEFYFYIAVNGQNLYRNTMTTKEGRVSFANHLLSQIGLE